MRLPILVAGFTLILTVPAFAVAGQDEPAIIPLDLTAAGGPGLWLVCSGPTLQECGVASLWVQSNGLKGLQRTIMSHSNRPWDPDTKLTP